MPLRCRGRNLLLTERPYAGSLGSKLYVGVGGPNAIRYRVARAFNPAKPPLRIDTTRDVSVATAISPTNQLVYTLPAELVGAEVWYQVRTFADDYENDTLFRPRRLETDDDGDGDDTIYGTATVVELQKRDNGGLRITFVWRPVRDGIQPEQFRVAKLTGSGTIADVIVSAFGPGEYQADVVGLANAVDYTFLLTAETGGVEVSLVTDIAFTGDAQGPPVVTNVVAVEA